MVWPRACPALLLALAGLTGCRTAQAPETAPLPSVAPAAGPAVPPDPAPTGRLGDAVRPLRSSLEIRVDPRSNEFRGSVAIDLEVTRPVSAIWLNGKNLAVSRAALVRDGREVALRGLASPAESGLLGFASGARIEAGPARLVIDYGGRLGSDSGLFRQKVDGSWYAFTDFEPTDARLAVPCFDDPRFKVPWQVTLRVPNDMRAFANAPEVGASAAEPGWRRVEFAATRPLPSYLVAFAVGPFDVLDGPTRPVPMRVIATRGRAKLGAEALAVAPLMLAELERYLGSETPFAKVDLVAVPTFNGAMENPGLVTFADSILLVDPADRGTPAWRERQRLMAGILAHELAHYWFGDLITMAWWNELWLNEGLATFMSDRVMAAVSPADAGLILDVADKRTGLDLDLAGVDAPVRRSIRQPPDIGDQFSALIYRKGGAVLAMLEAYLGEERMRDGLRRYAAAHVDGSVTTADLAAALSAGAGRDLAPALASFLDQPGVPVVEASLSCTGPRPVVALRQAPYAALGRAPVRRLWQVPVCVAFEGGAAPACALLAEEAGSIELPTERCPAWIHPNPGERGYYVYALPPALLRALARSALTPREQAGLVDDVASLLAAGRVPLDAALDAVWTLARRGDANTLVRSSDILSLVARSLVGPRERRAFAGRLRAAYGPAARRLGLVARTGESGLEGDVRQAIIPLVGRDGDERELQRDALHRLAPWIDQPGRRDPPSRAEFLLLYQLAPLAGGGPLFSRALASGRGHAARTLGGFRQPELVQRALAAIRAGRLGPAESLDVLAAFVRDGTSHDAALPDAVAEYADLASRLADPERRRSAAVFAGACRSSARPGVEEALRRGLGVKGKLTDEARAVLDAIQACAAFREHYLGSAPAALR